MFFFFGFASFVYWASFQTCFIFEVSIVFMYTVSELREVAFYYILTTVDRTLVFLKI